VTISEASASRAAVRVLSEYAPEAGRNAWTAIVTVMSPRRHGIARRAGQHPWRGNRLQDERTARRPRGFEHDVARARAEISRAEKPQLARP
jgi:hypothetical protein